MSFSFGHVAQSMAGALCQILGKYLSEFYAFVLFILSKLRKREKDHYVYTKEKEQCNLGLDSLSPGKSDKFL